MHRMHSERNARHAQDALTAASPCSGAFRYSKPGKAQPTLPTGFAEGSSCSIGCRSCGSCCRMLGFCRTAQSNFGPTSPASHRTPGHASAPPLSPPPRVLLPPLVLPSPLHPLLILHQSQPAQSAMHRPCGKIQRWAGFAGAMLTSTRSPSLRRIQVKTLTMTGLRPSREMQLAVLRVGGPQHLNAKVV